MELTDLQKARSLTLLYKDVTSFEVTFRVENTVNRGRNFAFTGLSTVVPTCASPSPPPTSPPPPPPTPPCSAAKQHVEDAHSMLHGRATPPHVTEAPGLRAATGSDWRATLETRSTAARLHTLARSSLTP